MGIENNLSEGMVSLLLNAHTKSYFQGKRYYFDGDINQMGLAEKTARQLGVKVLIEGGIPFVTSEKDFNKVTDYLIDNKMDGYHHYVKKDVNDNQMQKRI